MKNRYQTHLITRACRLAVVLLLGIILLTSLSCSGPDFAGREKDNAAAIEKLEGRFDQLESGLSGVVFWQAVAALLFVLAGFALVGGAALGSRARRDQSRFHGQPGEAEHDRPNLDESAQ